MFASRGIRQAALAAALAAVFAAPAFASGDEQHRHDAGVGATLTLNQGKKWPTDAPLRQGMENIRAAYGKNVKYGAFAAKVNTEVAGIVQNCKLEPAADEQLHLVIAELLAGAEAMEGKVKGETPRAGAERVEKALKAYGRHFDHPGWKF